jgi:hypothetical protein
MSYPFVLSDFSADPVVAPKTPGGGRGMAPTASAQG